MEIIYLLLRAATGVALVVLLARLNGLRSFSKMSGFDFAITVATGSVLAAVVTADKMQAYLVAMGALVALFVVQRASSQARSRSDSFHQAIDNTALLLMENGEILQHNMLRGRVTHDDLMGKLREANALRLADVRAVVLEDTGDVSVLHGADQVDDCLLENVRR
ncbi:DUF421 domain-containing protein [Palleronia pelagia]|uniref:YetF C-terminal domain-containing protein n=1 Tax=Palleronia pelagia TaxID=387096 RepID=A0A1H8FA19_9RHOB|nr:YetF domain-containing protein [Palleronia pelagia]SEN28415.1 Protein of unknown function [Palleronia pelagia]